jgi:hypothetical protein
MQYWYSGKHKRHGAAVQTVAAPDGELLWVSGVLPGRTVDITAARRFKIAEKVLAFLGLLADLRYIGLHPQVITGYKRKRGEKELPEASHKSRIWRPTGRRHRSLCQIAQVFERPDPANWRVMRRQSISLIGQTGGVHGPSTAATVHLPACERLSMDSFMIV